MTYKPFKFTVVATCLHVDDDGEIVGEAETQPAVLYGVDALLKWANEFEAQLETAQPVERPSTNDHVRGIA